MGRLPSYFHEIDDRSGYKFAARVDFAVFSRNKLPFVLAHLDLGPVLFIKDMAFSAVFEGERLSLRARVADSGLVRNRCELCLCRFWASVSGIWRVYWQSGPPKEGMGVLSRFFRDAAGRG